MKLLIREEISTFLVLMLIVALLSVPASIIYKFDKNLKN